MDNIMARRVGDAVSCEGSTSWGPGSELSYTRIHHRTTGPTRSKYIVRRFPNQAQIGAIWKYNVSREMGEHKTDSAPSSSDSQAGSLE
jgi:hypothetical protein